MYLMGILAGWALAAPLWATGVLAALAAAGAAAFQRRDRIFAVFALAGAFFVSWFLFGVDEAVYSNTTLSGYLESRKDAGRFETLRGTVTQAGLAKDGGLVLTVRAEEVNGGGKSARVSGVVWLRYPYDKTPEPKFGERWVFEGRLKPVSGMKPYQRTFYRRNGVSARMSLERWGASKRLGPGRVSLLMRAGDALRDRFVSVIDSNISPPYNQVIGQMMLGKSKEMDNELYETFRRAGLVHILVVSGMNVWIMLATFLFLGFLWKRRPFPSFVILTAMLLLYYAVTGGGASIMRATIMGLVFLVGLLFGAEYSAKPALFAAALLMMALNPFVVFNVGAQLTFLAAGGVIFIYPALAAHFQGRGLLSRVLRVALVSIAAQLPLYPVLAYYFNQFCVVSPVSNLLVVPLVGVVLPLDFVMCVVGLIPGRLVVVPAFLTEMSARLVVFLTRFFAALPFSNIDVASPSVPWMVVYGAGLILLVWTLRRMADGTDRQIVNGVLGIALVGAALITWDVWRPPLKDMRVTYFDVGEGDSALVEAPAGGRGGRVLRILVDGGGSWSGSAGTFDAGERVIGKCLRRNGVRRLDAVMLSHPDMDHMNGLLWVFNNIKVDRYIDTAMFADTACMETGSKAACELAAKYGPGPKNAGPGRRERYAELLSLVRKKGIEYEPVRDGMFFEAPSGFEIRILNPDSFSRAGEDDFKNNLSMALQMVYGNGSAFFSGDIQKEGEARLARCYGTFLPSSVLKVPHHGSATSSSEQFLKAVRPQAAVISTGGPRFYGHPNQNVVEAYGKAGIRLFRTDEQGTVECDIGARTGAARCILLYGAKEEM